MLVLGDVHANEEDNREALFAVYDAVNPDVALQVGDLQEYDLPAHTWFVAGNNEDLDVVEALRAGHTPSGVDNAHLLASTVADVEGLRVAGLSGNFAPTKYDLAREELEGDRRRHFTHEDVEALLAVGEGASETADVSDDVDVLLTHEAPHGLLHYGYDPGCEHVDDLLAALEPDLCLVGHHERHAESVIQSCRVVSLVPVWEGYYTLDPVTLELDRHDPPK